MTPLTMIQPARLDASRRCSIPYMIEATPSMMKNTIRTRVRDTDPLTGQASRITPATMAMMAETSDHQNPGAPFAQNVVTSPTHAADEKQPAEQDGDRKRRQRRYDDRQQAEQDEDDAFDQEQHPVFTHRFGHGALSGTEIGLVHATWVASVGKFNAWVD